MKKFLSAIPCALLLAFAATASVQAGPGVDYFKRVSSVSASAKTARDTAALASASNCKITEVVQVTPGVHGVPLHQVVSSKMDCSTCNDSSMACCAIKAKS